MASARRYRSGLVACLAAFLAAATATAPGVVTATAESVSWAEDLVRQTYFEGLPSEAARDLDDAAVARLAEMLADPAEAPFHGNIAIALGYSGRPAAYTALTEFAASPVIGEVDRATFRARTQVLLALGHLARRDGRALRWLLDAQTRPAEPPSWTFRHHRGASLRTLLDEQLLTALALSRSPAAARHIDELIAETRGSDAASRRRRRHAQAARAMLESGSPGPSVKAPPR